MQICEYGDPTSDRILLQPVDDHDLAGIENEVAAIKEHTADFRLIAVKADDWNRDLSPWSAPPVFGNEPFGGGASDFLNALLPLCADRSKTYYLGGYSLAGLFALWAAHETDAFFGVAAASPSVWFPGFAAYMQTHPIRAQRVYLSLGDREEKTRNPVMATVGTRIKEAYDLLKRRGTDCVLEWNPGNHFKDPDLRTARAFLWVLGETNV
ncbi:MAG: esterase [Clostridia bacterium]|nr:esterase [Clostridia bacterium]